MTELQRIKLTRAPFNYKWPGMSRTSVIRQTGAYPVGYGKGEVHPDIASAAIEEGYAQRFNPRGKAAKTSRQEQASKEADAADTRESDRVDQPDHADNDRTDDLPPVADAG